MYAIRRTLIIRRPRISNFTSESRCLFPALNVTICLKNCSTIISSSLKIVEEKDRKINSKQAPNNISTHLRVENITIFIITIDTNSQLKKEKLILKKKKDEIHVCD